MANNIELMTLAEALDAAEGFHSHRPGAVTDDGHGHAFYNMEDDAYDYIPDTSHKGGDHYSQLEKEQLLRLALFADERCWIPVSNFAW